MTAHQLRSRNCFGRAITRFDELSKTTPFLVNLRPSGTYPMEDGQRHVDGRQRCYNEDVVRPLAMPLAGEGGTVSLFGNLSPDGAVLKQTGRLAAFAQASRPRRRLRGPRGSPPSYRGRELADRRRLRAGAQAGAIPLAQTGKKNSSPLIKELPLSSGIFSF